MCIRPATKHSTMYVFVRAAQDQKDITLSVLHKVLGIHKLSNSQLLIEACVMCYKPKGLRHQYTYTGGWGHYLVWLRQGWPACFQCHSFQP